MQTRSFAQSILPLAAIILALLGVRAPSEESQSAADHPVTENHRKFLNQLLNAVSHKDASWIAEHMRYPLIVEADGKRQRIRSAAEFADVVRSKLDDALVQKIQKAATQPLFSNYQGVMLGDGIVWFDGKPGSMKILAFGDFAYQPDRIRKSKV